MERYYSYSRFIKEYFGEKLYKICIDGGFTCPNRDGTLATGGCIFCSEGGSGEFTENASLSVSEQIHLGKSQTSRKYQGEHYIAYFQAFTNTYAPVDRLRLSYPAHPYEGSVLASHLSDLLQVFPALLQYHGV